MIKHFVPLLQCVGYRFWYALGYASPNIFIVTARSAPFKLDKYSKRILYVEADKYKASEYENNTVQISY